MTGFATFCCHVVGWIGQEDHGVNGMAPMVIFIAVASYAQLLTNVVSLARTLILWIGGNGKEADHDDHNAPTQAES